MNVVYAFPNNMKGKVNAIVEEDRYGKYSFAKVGYIIKEGESFGFENKTLLVLRNASEEFKKQADEKLKDIEGLEIISDEKTSEVVKKINEEEEAAQSGFGSIFG